MKKKIWQRIFAIIVTFSLFLNTAGSLLTFSYAQEASISAESESSPSHTESVAPTRLSTEEPTVSPTPEITTTPTPKLDELITLLSSDSATIDISSTQSESSATLAPPVWNTVDELASTTGPVVLNQIYIAPQNDKVTVTFTKLPESPGKLTIKEVKLSKEEQESIGAFSDAAYDITSTMEDGTFEYDLTLLLPDSAKDKDVEVKSTESLDDLDGAKKVDQPQEKKLDTVTITGLNHFTVFVVASPTSGTDINSVGTITWSNTRNIYASDDSRVSSSLDDNEVSHYLKATGYNFAIPSNSTIKGIVVDIERKAQSPNIIKDNRVRIIKGGIVGATDKADTSTFWRNSDTNASYGGTTDLWGETWTPADIDASDFGAALSVVKDTTIGAATDADVDYIKITVYYDTPPNTPTLSSPADGAITADTTTDLTWTAAQPVDPDLGDTVTYKVVVDNNADFSSAEYTASNLSSTSTTTSALAEGTYSWRVGATDNNGYVGNWTTARTFIIDTSTPSITYNFPTAGGQTTWHNSDPGNLIDIDFIWGGGSPLDNAQRKIGSGSFVNIFTKDQSLDYTTNWDITWGSLAEGLNEISLKVKDTVANTRTDSYVDGVSGFLLRKDTIVPDTTSSGTDADWHGSDVTVNFSCSDLTSGCDKTYYTTDGTTPTTSSLFGSSVTLSQSGIYTIKYFSKDNAGNSELVQTAANTVKIDKTAPADPSALPPAGDYTTDQSVILASYDGSGSGVASIYYTTNGTTPSNVNGTLYGEPIVIGVDTTLKAIVYDVAGNASGVLTAVYGIAPVISAEAASTVTNISTTITWTTDDLSTSRVIYDTVPHVVLGAAPNYGYASSTAKTDTAPKVISHSVIVSGLTASTTYYYRTVSHGSPEAVGTEKSFVTTSTPSTSGGGGGGGGDGRNDGLGCASHDCSGGSATPESQVLGALTQLAAASGFSEGILGVSTQPAELKAKEKKTEAKQSDEEVLGNQTTPTPKEKKSSSFLFGVNPVFPIDILLAILAALGFFFFRRK